MRVCASSLLLGCSALSDGALELLSTGACASHLLSLDVSHVWQLTDACVPALRRCTALQSLTAVKCLRITDQSWQLLVPPPALTDATQPVVQVDTAAVATGRMPDAVGAAASTTLSLRTLDLSGCTVGASGMVHLSRAWSRYYRSLPVQPTAATALPPAARSIPLLSLSLSDCAAGVTDEALGALLPWLPALTHLSLASCSRLTSAALAHLARHCRRLRTLHVHQLVDVSEAALVAAVTQLPSLREVGLDEIPAVTDATLDALALHCLSLIHI